MRILLVDDEERFATAVRQGLEAEGLAVDLAHDGNEGLWMARSNDYDAIVLDILLPGLNGYRICAELRDGGNWTPILMLTALDEDLDEAEALDTGADDYLSKPFSFVVLVARLRALLRRGAAPRPAVLQVGDLRLDPATREVWRGKQAIDLSAREFGLMETLMRRPGQVFTQPQLLDAAWDLGYEQRSNVVEVYVRYLREKVDRPFGVESIETVRGVGYRLRKDGGA